MTPDMLFCRDLCARLDYDRFVIVMSAPRATRPHLWAPLAFHNEAARAREAARTPGAGFLRLAWWSEALKNRDAGQPVTRALRAAIEAHDLPIGLFEDILEARRDEIDQADPADLPAMAARARAINGPLARIFALITGAPDSPACLEALATAYGLIGALRAAGWLARQGRNALPGTPGAPPDARAARPVADHAQACLAAAVPLHPLFRKQKAVCRLYLSRLARADFNPLDSAFQSPVPFLALRSRLYDQ